MADESNRTLVESGRFEELRARAANEYDARRLYVNLICLLGREDELRRYSRSSPQAREALGKVLAAQGKIDYAKNVLNGPKSTKDAPAPGQPAEVPERDPAELDGLREQAKTGDKEARYRLAEALAKHQRVDELRALIGTIEDDSAFFDTQAHWVFVHLLADLGRHDELRERAEAGLPRARGEWADVVLALGREDEARALADRWGGSAAHAYVNMLEHRGRFKELAARVQAGDPVAASKLVFLVDPPFCDNPEDRIRPYGS